MKQNKYFLFLVKLSKAEIMKEEFQNIIAKLLYKKLYAKIKSLIHHDYQNVLLSNMFLQNFEISKFQKKIYTKE